MDKFCKTHKKITFMKKKAKKSLISLLKAGWGCLFLFGILWNTFGLSPKFPMALILACSALVALLETIRFFQVWKKFRKDHRVNLKHFSARAANWVLLTLYWYLVTCPDTGLVQGLRAITILSLIPIFVLMIKHSKPYTIKFV